MVHVPYAAGQAQVLPALIAGDVSVFITEMGSMKPMVDGKRVKMLATLGDERSPLYPDVPSVQEAGMPELRGIFSPFFFGVFVEPRTSEDRIAYLNAAINKALAQPRLRERMQALGYSVSQIGGTTPAQFREVVVNELDRVETTVREARIPTGQQ